MGCNPILTIPLEMVPILCYVRLRDWKCSSGVWSLKPSREAKRYPAVAWDLRPDPRR